MDREVHHGELPARTVLWRIHSVRRKPTEYRPGDAAPRPGHGGGRFDSTPADLYPTMYVATEQCTAITETLLRNLEFDGQGYRVVGLRHYRDKVLSAVETTTAIRLISLVSAVNLAAIAQDDWLVQAEPHQFPVTRKWAHFLRNLDPTAAGITWQSKRDRPHRTIVLFGDRTPDGLLTPTEFPTTDFSSPEGAGVLRQLLRPYYAALESPTGRRA